MLWSEKMPEEHILIVDDEPYVCDILSQLFISEGYRVKAAVSGLEAIDLMKEKDFSLVISDIRLSDISGIEVLRNARTLLKGVPVIMITGFAATESAVYALKLGAYDYMIKPLNLDEVILSARRAIGSKQMANRNTLRVEILREISEHILPVVERILSSLDSISDSDVQLSKETIAELDNIRFSLNEIEGVFKRFNPDD